MLAGAHIAMNGYEGDHDLVVMPSLDGFDVILGRSFLKMSKAVVHHENATIIWPEPSVHATPTNSQSIPTLAIVTDNPWQILATDDDVGDEGNHDNVDVQAPSTSTHSKATIGRSGQGRDRQWPAAKSSFASNDATNAKQLATIPPAPYLTASVRAALGRIQARVGLYDVRMKPKDGKLPKCRGQFNHKMELNNVNAEPVKGRAIPLNAEERVQLALDIRELGLA